MDKRVIFAVAGSGKTTYIINSLNRTKRSLIITYTNANYYNILNKILNKFNGSIPDNITVMKYFHFLYFFCYKPYLSDKIKAKGIYFNENKNHKIPIKSPLFFITPSRFLYYNRIAFLLDKHNIIDSIIKRIQKYFDELIIDEIQDISGRDFNFLRQIMPANINMLFVGDFYQHTYDTSRDGNVNKNLFNDITLYESYFTKNKFICDKTSLLKSWRCSPNVCNFISSNLGINIESNNSYDIASEVIFVKNEIEKYKILNDNSIVKLHYQNSKKFGLDHKNWGETKGEDHYNDVCILLNKTTAKKFFEKKFNSLASSTRNKLYVAFTRARGNVFIFNE